MAGYATWFYNQGTGLLNEKYSEDIARLVSIRAHLAQSQTWASNQWQAEQNISSAALGRSLKAYMVLLDEPLIMIMGVDGAAKHAVVVYGYDETGFFIYDVNHQNQSFVVSFDGSSFGAYSSYNTFGYVSVASLGRSEDFEDLTQEAIAGFVHSENIEVSSPQEGATITTATTPVVGQLTGSISNGASLYLETKGVGRQIAIQDGGSFSSVAEVSSGENTLVFLAGVDISQQSNWYKNSATLVRNVYGDLSLTQLLVTLTWNQNNTDLDLYVTEPEGETIWYSDKTTPNGLELDIDDIDGFGPEHGTLESASTATALSGLYRIRVHYYSDYASETTQAATGTVSVVVNEGAENQLVRTFNFTIAVDDSTTDGPNGSGAAWTDIAVVDVINGIITEI